MRLIQFVEKPDWFINLGVGPTIVEAHRARKAWPRANILGLEPDERRYKRHSRAFPGELLCCAVTDLVGPRAFFRDPGRKLWSCLVIEELNTLSYPVRRWTR